MEIIQGAYRHVFHGLADPMPGDRMDISSRLDLITVWAEQLKVSQVRLATSHRDRDDVVYNPSLIVQELKFSTLHGPIHAIATSPADPMIQVYHFSSDILPVDQIFFFVF
jgi:hypothetical protein